MIDNNDKNIYIAKELCSIVFKKNDSFNNASAKRQSVILNVIVDEVKGNHVPYDEITRLVFEINKVEDVEKICNYAFEKLDAVRANNREDKKGYKYVSDFKRHIELSKIQKIAIIKESLKAKDTAKDAINVSERAIDTSNEAKKIAKEVKKIADKVKEESDEASDNLREMNDIKSKIYTDFISILGIFTAITFATFGGIQMLANVFGKAETSSHGQLGNVLILGSIYILGTYFLLLALLEGISRLTKDKGYVSSKWISRLIISFCVLLIIIGIVLKIKNA